MMKKCKICGEEKEECCFPKYGKRGYWPQCKLCFNKESRERYDSKAEHERYLKKKKKYGARIKELNKIAAAKYRSLNLDAYRAKRRNYYHKWKQQGKILPRDKKKAVEATIKWKQKNKEKVKASELLRRQVKNGKINKSKFCQICGKKEKLEGHHFDYKFPLNVIWTCRSCHYILDRIRKQQEKALKKT